MSISEVDAIKAIDDALSQVDDLPTRARVLRWANDRFGAGPSPRDDRPSEGATGHASPLQSSGNQSASLGPRASAWLARSGISVESLQAAIADDNGRFEIALESLPGDTNSQRVRSAYLLAGVLAFLSSDAPEFADEEGRTICRHFGCYDHTNHSKSLKAIGNALIREGKGYRLTAVGLRDAADLLRQRPVL